MPLYEYRCGACGSVFEVMQKFSDDALTVHEDCGGPVQRLLSAPALQFKGSGWYITDYARGGNKGESGKTESKPAETKGEAKGETKSEPSGAKSTDAAKPSS